ncbi:MAG TPA: MarP family serine protease [Acidimicrobiales bacterium]|nr:MarP family serine protease [Acidimicrobiales bacterium]
MNWVDLVLLVAVVAAAVHGLRLGALIQVLTFGGFWLGLTLGALLSIALVSSLRPGPAKSIVTLVVVLTGATLFGVGGRIVGGWSNIVLRRHHLGGVDADLGVAVAVVAVLLSAWLLGSVLSQSRYTWLGSAISGSDVLRTVDEVLPPVPSVFAHVQAFLSAEGVPPVFAQIPPQLAGPVSTPTAAEADSIAAGAQDSTVKVIGGACGVTQEGTAFEVKPGVVATNAHVIAGEASPRIVVNGVLFPATPVFFDPQLDLALLRTSAPMGKPLVFDPNYVTRGTVAAITGYPENGPLTVVPAGVATRLVAAGRDIYNQGLVTRNVYELDGVVRPGNSGSPLVATNGLVVGVVFSRSTTNAAVGYALASPDVLAKVVQAENRTTPVSTHSCSPD